MVTAGAAAALATATAACMAGADPAKIWQLPDTTGMKYEVIMSGGRISFDNAIRLAGAKLVLALNDDELNSAIGERTVMVYTTARKEPLERVIRIAKQTRVPVLVDWAAGIPPIENLSLPWKMGADLYTFSGGKGLCGPQCSGLLLGRKDLIDAALAQSSPWEGALCRSMKVGKEEIIGVLAAVDAWQKYDLPAMFQEWGRRAAKINWWKPCRA
jgi:L-seryl-tRNA(Ser) seleniumtransferase